MVTTQNVRCLIFLLSYIFKQSQQNSLSNSQKYTWFTGVLFDCKTTHLQYVINLLVIARKWIISCYSLPFWTKSALRWCNLSSLQTWDILHYVSTSCTCGFLCPKTAEFGCFQPLTGWRLVWACCIRYTEVHRREWYNDWLLMSRAAARQWKDCY